MSAKIKSMTADQQLQYVLILKATIEHLFTLCKTPDDVQEVKAALREKLSELI